MLEVVRGVAFVSGLEVAMEVAIEVVVVVADTNAMMLL
jgi:hypothetical protein